MKLTNRIAFSVAIVAVALMLGTASAQQKGKGGFRGGGGMFGAFGNSLVTIAAVEAVQKDLGVSGDTASKLNSLRDDLNAARQKEYQSAGINPQDFQNLSAEQRQKMNQIGNKLNDEFNPKLKEAVSADQYKRLQQISLQAGLRISGPRCFDDARCSLGTQADRRPTAKAKRAQHGICSEAARFVYRRLRSGCGYQAPR